MCKHSLWEQNNEMSSNSTSLQCNLQQMYLTARVRLALYQTGIEKRPFESGHDVAAGPSSHIYRLKLTHSIHILFFFVLFCLRHRSLQNGDIGRHMYTDNLVSVIFDG